MNNKTVLITILALVIVGSVVVLVVLRGKNVGEGDMTPTTAPLSRVTDGTVDPASSSTDPSYSGTVLAGSDAPFIDYNASDYQKAIQSDKLVVLYFYANWCPICREELVDTHAAFNALTTDKVIGFRINFNDSDTDRDERELARQFGIAYQHSKVFLKNGERILKSPEPWTLERYMSEINKALE